MPQPQKCCDECCKDHYQKGHQSNINLPCVCTDKECTKSHQPKPEVEELNQHGCGMKHQAGTDCPSPASTEEWEKTITPELRTELVRLAYKYIPLPSGCSNCLGDLHQGCTDECINSSRQQHEKVMDFVRTIYLLLSSRDQQLRQRIVEKLGKMKKTGEEKKMTAEERLLRAIYGKKRLMTGEEKSAYNLAIDDLITFITNL